MSAQPPMPPSSGSATTSPLAAARLYNPALVEVAGSGTAIRTRREQLGLTQRQVAIAMHERLGQLVGEASCLRAVREVEREARRFKSGHYAEALLRVLYGEAIAE